MDESRSAGSYSVFPRTYPLRTLISHYKCYNLQSHRKVVEIGLLEISNAVASRARSRVIKKKTRADRSHSYVCSGGGSGGRRRCVDAMSATAATAATATIAAIAAMASEPRAPRTLGAAVVAVAGEGKKRGRIDFWLREYGRTRHAIGCQFKMLVIAGDAVLML